MRASIKPGTRQFYAHYRLASNYTHPGSMLTDLYIDIEHLEPGGMRFNTNPSLIAAGAWLKYEAYLLILGGLAWDRVDTSRYHHALLTRLASIFEVPVNRLQPTTDGWRNSYRADRDRKRRKKASATQTARDELARTVANVTSRRSSLKHAETGLLRIASLAYAAGVPLNEVAHTVGVTPASLAEYAAARIPNAPANAR